MNENEVLERPHTDAAETNREAGVIIVGGRNFREDSKGNLVPENNVRPEDLLQDQAVRKIMAFALDLSSQIDRFRDHTMADLLAFDELVFEKYGAKIGGAKGNRTYQTFDGLMKIVVQVSDLQDFGPELQAAKSLVDECMREWSAPASEELQAIITTAFQTDKEGQVNRGALMRLLNTNIKDPRWVRAMEAVRGSIRITGSKEYVRFYVRKSQNDRWITVTIDLAKAGE